MQFKEITKKHAEAKLYGNIGTFYANGDAFSEMLDMCESLKYDELTIRMHCYGGSIFEGNAMYNAMQRSKLKINIAIDGVAASMGCFILPAIENVTISDNAFGMVHRPGCHSEGDADTHLQNAKLLQDMEANFIKRLNERTGMAADEIKAKWFDGKDHWLNATEMVQYGFATKVVPATAKNIRNLDKETLAGMNIEALYNRYAACLDTSPLNPPKGDFPKGHLDNSNNNNKNENQMKKELIEKFKLQGVTAESTDAEVLTAMQQKVGETESRLQSMEAEAKTKRDTAVKTMLDKAQADGKVTAETRPFYDQIGQSVGVEALAVALGNTGTKTPIAQMLVPESKNSSTSMNEATKNWDWYQANAAESLEKMQLENPEQFKELYKAKYGSLPA